jgi:hypothetical protein
VTGPPGFGYDFDALRAQAGAYYQESQVERFLDELALREGRSFARATPVFRHFGTPEYALYLSWNHQRVAWVQVAKVMEIYMGYAGTLLIGGKSVTVLRRHQWQQNRSLVQQALERAYQEPRVETRVADTSW